MQCIYRLSPIQLPKRALGVFSQLVLVGIALAIAYMLRFDLAVPAGRFAQVRNGILLVMGVKGLVFLFGRADRGAWRYVGMDELVKLAGLNVIGSGAFTIAALLLMGRTFPLSVYGIDLLACLLLTIGMRISVRFYHEIMARESSSVSKKGVLIYGAGRAGGVLVREFRDNPKLGVVLGFLDDDRRKYGTKLMGMRVYGPGRAAPEVVNRFKRARIKVDEIIIAMPSATGRQMQEALSNCRSAGVTCRKIPSLGELLTGKVLSAQIRSISVTDLLGREPVQLDENRIRESMAARCVLVTGAAGSIGSELCRQIARQAPRKLIALDQAESDLFRIDNEMRENFPELDISAVIADIRCFERLNELVKTERVDAIFHAAAYKHVPLMEDHVWEAIQNNVIGTWNLVRAASRNQVSNFLMISSDKAVNPTNIMGTTKRAAELIVSAMQNAPLNTTRFVSVRFGNVLGSNGSVVPTFQKQIAAGGPVTITHPEIRRYFMTIPEAVQLVLQASTMGEGSEIFVLEMGEPVKIVDLARNMIRLAGFEPEEEIEIRFVGLRPGEKLFEELITSGENIMPTYHEKIKIFKSAAAQHRLIEGWVETVQESLAKHDDIALVSQLHKLVPEFTSTRWGLSAPAAPRGATSVMLSSSV